MYLNFVYLCLFEQLHRVDQQQVSEFSPAPPLPWARHCGALLHCFSGLVFHALGPIGENIRTWLRCRRMQTMCINTYIYICVCVCLFVCVMICCLYIDRYDIARLHISYMYTHTMYVYIYICICRRNYMWRMQFCAIWASTAFSRGWLKVAVPHLAMDQILAFSLLGNQRTEKPPSG